MVGWDIILGNLDGRTAHTIFALAVARSMWKFFPGLGLVWQMAGTGESPEFYLELARKAEEQADIAGDEPRRASWGVLAQGYRRLGLTIQEHAEFLTAMTPHTPDKAAQ